MMILVWGGTIVTSLVIETSNQLKILKKLADKGYKIENFKLFNDYLIFLPFFNLFTTLKKVSENKSIENLSIEQLEIQENIVPLSNKEKNIYQKKKNFITTFKINLKPQVDPNMVLVFKEQNQENIIYFTVENDKYIISSIKGPLSKSSRKIQYKILEEQMSDMNFTHPKNSYKQEESIKKEEKNFRSKINEYENLRVSLIEKNTEVNHKVYKKVA